MSDLPENERLAMERLDCPSYDTTPWAAGPPLAERRVTLVSTAGLIERGGRPVAPRDPRYRVIPRGLADEDILCSHVSVNFDRTGFQRDLECVLPRRRLEELAAAGVIGAAADRHYAFMGATEPRHTEPHARRLAGELHDRGVDTALLVPV